MSRKPASARITYFSIKTYKVSSHDVKSLEGLVDCLLAIDEDEPPSTVVTIRRGGEQLKVELQT